MRMRHPQFLTVLAAALGIISLAAAPQAPGQNPQEKTKSTQNTRIERFERAAQEKGGKFLPGERGETPDPSQAKKTSGVLFRPMMPSGGSGAEAIEEATFTLHPGDMLELECTIPKNRTAHEMYAVEDSNVVAMYPAGVRRLVPLAIVGGQPKRITGEQRYLALFQAQNEGETIIHLNIGLRQLQYRVKVVSKPISR